MRMYDIINNKKRGYALTQEEIAYAVTGYTAGAIGEAQMAAWLMAVCINGMNKQETFDLCRAMAESGETVSFDFASGRPIVDKHSTGGVGDKTTLIVAPMVAACGVGVAKMSGRGLGHTGGTIDKLESIPGFRTALDMGEFRAQLDNIGIAITSQSANLAPADKKIYALRDITAIVDSIPLIAASIMSKKLASGANSILLDVKVGSGAFMKDLDKARELAQLMVEIGRAANKPTIAVITDMNAPTGYAIGNSLEVAESLEILRGRGASDLREICIELAAGMLELAGFSKKDGLDMAINSLESGIALKKFNELVIAQGGKIELMETAPVIRKISSNVQGYIKEMDTEGLGIVACMLGAGRNNPNDSVYPLSGILLHKKPADYVYQGETIAELHTSSIEMLSPAIDKFLDSISFSNTPCMKKPLILGVLS